jgi:hypothetical protein
VQHANKLYYNFILMCVAFSVNHGCVVSCLAYSSAELGDDLGGYGSGTLYICYALSAFLLSKPLVSMYGGKQGLLFGVYGYCIYVGGFLFAILVKSAAYPVFLVSAGVGGIAGGILWPAQGRYFARNSKLYAEASNIPVENANASFAGIFAMCYLGVEMVTKVLATVVFLTAPGIAEFLIFTIYTCAAVLSCFVMSGLHPLDDPGSRDFSVSTILVNVVSTGRLIVEDARFALMIPFQVAFGFTSSLVPFYIFGTVIADSSELGGTWIGLLSAVVVFTGAVIAIPTAWVANKFGKPVVMTIGGLGLLFAGAIMLALSDATLGTWNIIVLYLVVYGIGRGTWENTNKAVIADLFKGHPELSTAAFAGVSFSNGIAGAIGYFTFPNMTRNNMATICTIFASLAIVSYWIMCLLQRKRRAGSSDNIAN